MKSNFTVEFFDGYICIRNAADYIINPENINSFWDLAAESCKTHDCTKVLREGHIASRQANWTDALDSVRKGAKAVPRLRLAYCFTN